LVRAEARRGERPLAACFGIPPGKRRPYCPLTWFPPVTRDWRELGRAADVLLREYDVEIRRATQLMNAGAPSIALACPAGHLTAVARYPARLGGFSRARRPPGPRLVDIPPEVGALMEEMAAMVDRLGDAMRGLPLPEVEIEGVRLGPSLRRLLAAAALQSPELARLLAEVEDRRAALRARALEMLAGVKTPPCPHRDPQTGRACGLETKAVITYNVQIELLGLQHLAHAASAMARLDAMIRRTGFDKLMHLQGVGQSGLAFLFYAAAVNKWPDRPSRLISYLGIAPVKVCVRCRAVYKGGVTACPRCGRPTVSTLPSRAASAWLGGVPLLKRTRAQSRAWVLGQALLAQARRGAAPAVMAALADLAGRHYARYLDCYNKCGGDPDRMLEEGCAGARLPLLIKRHPGRAVEFTVSAAVNSAVWELVKIYINAAVNARNYLDGGKPAEPYSQHRRYWPVTVFWRRGGEPPEDYVRWHGVDPEDERKLRERLNRRGEELARVYAERRKGRGEEAWEAWREVLARALEVRI